MITATYFPHVDNAASSVAEPAGADSGGWSIDVVRLLCKPSAAAVLTANAAATRPDHTGLPDLAGQSLIVSDARDPVHPHRE
jgi:hypothetical protein